KGGTIALGLRVAGRENKNLKSRRRSPTMPAAPLRSSTVVQFPGGRKVRLDSPSIVPLVQNEILRSGRYYTDIAIRADISHSTVHNIAAGETKRPSFNTIAAILGALGWTIYAER